MPSQRDEFPEDIRRILRERVGNRCSRPECGCATTGPNEDPNKATRIGIAAHISAAAANGPRYNPQLTSEERKSISNAIWLCCNCAKLIDSDSMKYTEHILKAWRLVSEQRAYLELSGISPRPEGEEERQPDIPHLNRRTTLKTISSCDFNNAVLAGSSLALVFMLMMLAKVQGVYLLRDIPFPWMLVFMALVAFVALLKWRDEALILKSRVRDDGVVRQLSGERLAMKDAGGYTILQCRGDCQYLGCHGEVALTEPPARYRQRGDARFVGICTVAGRQHTHAIDFNWVIQRETLDWRPIPDQSAN